MTDTHRCIAVDNCRKRENDGGPAFTEHPNTLCPGCRTRIEQAVHQLPRDWTELRDTLGERATNTGSKIRSSPTAAILISTRKDTLMDAIVDMADRAAAIVSDALHTEQPGARRKIPDQADRGSIAWCAAHHARPHGHRALTDAIDIIEPNIDLLAAAPPEPALVWKKPQRCDDHARLIDSAETTKSDDLVRRAYAAAGTCDDCNGWGRWGQERELVEYSGLQIALELVELHNQTRAELGLTRLRHRFPMPCPRCGNRVGRDDGQTIITCDDRTTCKATWTEREYQFLAGLITRERLDMEILKWLLAEAYSRLDTLQARANILKGSPDETRLAGAGTIILEHVVEITDAHPTPTQRAIATDREATEQRQTTEDNWNWQNEIPYRPPKPKPKTARTQVGSPIPASSLTTLVDIDPDAVLNGDARCRDCNMIHAGACP